jgi:hypothetical protein
MFNVHFFQSIPGKNNLALMWASPSPYSVIPDLTDESQTSSIIYTSFYEEIPRCARDDNSDFFGMTISALLLSYCHKKQENLFASLRLCARHFGCGHPH